MTENDKNTYVSKGISATKDWWKEMEDEAKRIGMNRSVLVRVAVNEYLKDSGKRNVTQMAEAAQIDGVVTKNKLATSVKATSFAFEPPIGMTLNFQLLGLSPYQHLCYLFRQPYYYPQSSTRQSYLDCGLPPRRYIWEARQIVTATLTTNLPTPVFEDKYMERDVYDLNGRGSCDS